MDLDEFMYLCFLSLILMQPTTENFWISKITPKYTQGKIFDSPNSHEINFEPTKYPWEKRLDPPKTYEKKFWTDEIATRKHFEPTIHPQEKISDPRNAHEDEIARWSNSTRSTRSTIARDQQNFSTVVVISLFCLLSCFVYITLA